jgi:hypothetical protein
VLADAAYGSGSSFRNALSQRGLTGKREGDQSLAVRRLAQHGRILRCDADRMLALLRQRRVVDHEHRIRATDQSIRLHEKLALERRFVPNAGANKMMELIVIGCRHPQGHWLHALALAGTDQTRDIERTHPSARLVAQMAQERPEPTEKVVPPVLCRSHRFVPALDEASGGERYHRVNLPK